VDRILQSKADVNSSPINYATPPAAPGPAGIIGRVLGWLSLLLTFLIPCTLLVPLLAVPLLAVPLVIVGFGMALAAVLLTDGRSVCGWLGLAPSGLLIAVALGAVVGHLFGRM
jgi:hypothetical protein